MQQANSMIATGGRDASRERRSRLVQGKAALPAAGERSRAAELTAVSPKPVAPVAVKQVVAAAPVSAPAPVAPAPQSATKILGGRAASLARRSALVQGKGALQKHAQATASTMTPVSSVSVVNSGAMSLADNSRQVSQAMRAQRARSGRGDSAPSRPTGRVREPSVIQYPPKVADTTTYAGQKVTGVRIGRGKSMTGDEPGANLPVSGTQYIGTESGYAPRMGGTKVGATRTTAGLSVTGTQVRNTIKVTGDESNSSLRITGEADQEMADDLMQRDDNAYAGSQFQRMHNPHGQSVFGGNLGRSAKAFGSRERDRERATEQSMNGRAISGTAIGRSANVTGDEPGSCRALTGSQYLKPANRQALCEAGNAGTARSFGNMGMNGRLDPVTGEKVSLSETWTRQRVSGVAVEHNPDVTGSEHGVCSVLTGTAYVGPGEYELNCTPSAASSAASRVTPTPGQGAGNRVTGNTARSTERVTGTHRGSDRGITGTAYYRADSEAVIEGNPVDHINARFSIRSPQREAQLQADATAVNAPTAEGRITGTFACGVDKITGNQEFHFSPRGRSSEKSRVSGEGSTEGRVITGSAWGMQKNVAGTEGYIAAERNPSRRDGSSHVFANASKFKGKGNATAPTQHLTGASGWSEKSTARVTLSGGCQG